jgi:hypothetical protein
LSCWYENKRKITIAETLKSSSKYSWEAIRTQDLCRTAAGGPGMRILVTSTLWLDIYKRQLHHAYRLRMHFKILSNSCFTVIFTNYIHFFLLLVNSSCTCSQFQHKFPHRGIFTIL